MIAQGHLSVNESGGFRILPPMKTIGARIRQLRDSRRLNQHEFGARLGVSRGAVGNWELDQGIKTENLAKIAEVFGCSMDWLASGRGAMTPKAGDADEADRDGDITRVSDDIPDLEKIVVPAGGIIELDVRAGMGGGGEVHTAYVRAGKEIATVDAVKPEHWILPQTYLREEMHAPAARIIVIETRGDSMAPTIYPGERVFIDTGHKMPSPDGIYAIRDRFGYVVVKRLQVSQGRENPHINIISDNKSHPIEVVGLDEIEVIGKVIAGIKLL